MNTQSTAHLRKSYQSGALNRKDLAVDPVAQFAVWFKQALDTAVHEPNAMTLSTATPEGAPSSRVVLLKGFGPEGFTFYTNYKSRKGIEIEHNPLVALNFFWPELERQVRIEGKAGRVSEAESEAYFHSRPPGSRLGAWVSEQSSVITSREVLEKRATALEDTYKDTPIPRPGHWGGYLVEPYTIEFWQGRDNRLHDRFRYRREREVWHIERLSP